MGRVVEKVVKMLVKVTKMEKRMKVIRLEKRKERVGRVRVGVRVYG